jgi:hypothetical protein
MFFRTSLFLVLISTSLFAGVGVVKTVDSDFGTLYGVCYFEATGDVDLVFSKANANTYTIFVVNCNTGSIKWQHEYTSVVISELGAIHTGTYGDKFVFYGKEIGNTTQSLIVLGYSSTLASPNPALTKSSVSNFNIESHAFAPAKISYEITAKTNVNIQILSADGRIVKSYEFQNQIAGQYNINWEGKNEKGEQLSSGIYFYVLKTPEYQSARKGILLGY